jgi:hypothetical protein
LRERDGGEKAAIFKGLDFDDTPALARETTHTTSLARQPLGHRGSLLLLGNDGREHPDAA